MAGGGDERRDQCGPGDEGGVERHVVEGEHPATVGVVHFLLQDGGRADRHALPGQVEAERHDQVDDLTECLAQRAGHHGARREQQRDPGRFGHSPGHRRGKQRGAAVADRRHRDEDRDVALGHGDARPVEVVPVEQDRHQEQAPVQKPVAAGSTECRGRVPPPQDIPRARRQPGRDRGKLAEQPRLRRLARFPLRAKQILAHGRGDQACRQVTAARDKQGDRGAALGVAGGRVQAQGDDAADGSREAAEGRRHRVRHHELVFGDHVRQRRRKRRQEEPVHAENQQDGEVERRSVTAGRHDRRRQHHEDRTEQRRPDQDLASRPPVDEDPGKRPDHRVRQVQDRERRRPGRRARKGRRVEEHIGTDPGGEDPVAGLRDQPRGQEPPEARHGEDRAQVSDER